jgi:hypothetical protein
LVSLAEKWNGVDISEDRSQKICVRSSTVKIILGI